MWPQIQGMSTCTHGVLTEYFLSHMLTQQHLGATHKQWQEQQAKRGSATWQGRSLTCERPHLLCIICKVCWEHILPLLPLLKVLPYSVGVGLCSCLHNQVHGCCCCWFCCCPGCCRRYQQWVPLVQLLLITGSQHSNHQNMICATMRAKLVNRVPAFRRPSMTGPLRLLLHSLGPQVTINCFSMV
jgi:hypothetical protein